MTGKAVSPACTSVRIRAGVDVGALNRMSRSHSLLDSQDAERRLAQAKLELEALQATKDYELDMEFFSKLAHLIATYDFVPLQVAEMLLTRERTLLGHSTEEPGFADLGHLWRLVHNDSAGSTSDRPGQAVAGQESETVS